MYALRSGVLIPPSAKKSLYDPEAYLGSQKTTEKALHRGLFNPHVIFAAPVTTPNPSNNDPFKKVGTVDADTMLSVPLFNLPGQSDHTYFTGTDADLYV